MLFIHNQKQRLRLDAINLRLDAINRVYGLARFSLAFALGSSSPGRAVPTGSGSRGGSGGRPGSGRAGGPGGGGRRVVCIVEIFFKRQRTRIGRTVVILKQVQVKRRGG